MVEYRFADGNLDRLPTLATELVGLKVDVIVAAGGGLIGRAAKSATGTIPAVTTNVEDPVSSGLVVSLARPGRNVTGLSAQIPELSPKRPQIMKEIVPVTL